MATKTDRELTPERPGRRRPEPGIHIPERVVASGRGRLRPRARLIRTMGAELISSETVAVLELVRNSYDADATLVEVIFNDAHLPNKARLEIRDNGHGMSREILLGPWLEPATAFKAAGSSEELGGDHSPKGRRRLGSKGVGRFATQRLGHKLLVVTTQGGPTELRAEFDWMLLDHADAYLDQLSVPWRELRLPPRSSRARKGTSLIISGLRDVWTEDRFDRLRLALSRLLGPGLGSHRPFRIELVINDVRERVLPALGSLPSMYSVSGEVRSSGIAVMQYGDLSGVVESWERSVHWPPVGVACGPFSFEVKAWDLDKPALIPFLKKAAVAHGLRDFRRLIREHSGISLYRDGFRILPYGEPDNDWLRLDRRRVNNPTARLSNNQILGSINIAADRNPLLQDQTNREGLVNNEAYVHLQQVVVELLSYLENRRFHARRGLGFGTAGPMRQTGATTTETADESSDARVVSTDPRILRLAATGYLTELAQPYLRHLYRQLGSELNTLAHELPALWGGAELQTSVAPSVSRAQERLQSLLEAGALPAMRETGRAGEVQEGPLHRVARVLSVFAERVVRLEVDTSIVGCDRMSWDYVVGSDFEMLFALLLAGSLEILEGRRKPRRLAIEVSPTSVVLRHRCDRRTRHSTLQNSLGARFATGLARELGATLRYSEDSVELVIGSRT